MSDRDVAASDDGRAAARVAAQAADSKQASGIVGFDVTGRLPLTDAFVICTARSERQMEAIDREVAERMRAAGHEIIRREGSPEGAWFLLDFGDVIVHVMRDDARHEYALERLWKDCPQIELRLTPGQSSGA